MAMPYVRKYKILMLPGKHVSVMTTHVHAVKTEEVQGAVRLTMPGTSLNAASKLLYYLKTMLGHQPAFLHRL